MIEVGVKAPDFTLPDHDGNDVSLSDYAGRKLIIAFYPADFSSVCTDQLSVYQEVLADIREQGTELIGISVDASASHAAFRESLGTEIPLLADFHPKGEVCRAYGALIEERGHANRSLVLVDEEGIVAFSHASPTPLEVPGANVIFDAIAAS